jgi:alkanesulfonate monooxygenase SsuD/methylene tetrahydromethanopterin reductase-like flavin-dependent oxidoreductase (luciferase family)
MEPFRRLRFRLGVAVSVLPCHNPIDVAEQYAMVDILSGGRLEFGAGSGYLKHEYDGYLVPVAEKRERFDEALEIIEKAWTGERFSYNGRFTRIVDTALQITPIQKPRPPILIAVLRDEAAREVGARGYALLTIPYAQAQGLEPLAVMTRAYRDAWAAGGRAPEQALVGCAVHSHVTLDPADIERHAKPALARYVRTRLYATSRPYEVLQEKELVTIGDPDRVISVIRHFEEAGFNLFLNIMDFGGMDPRAVRKSMEIFAREVMPAFK